LMLFGNAGAFFTKYNSSVFIKPSIFFIDY